MFKTKTHRTVASLFLGLACLAAPSRSFAVSPVQLSGAITGVVSDNLGVPQMGATVLLFNRQDRALGKRQTDEFGHFRFAGLLPDASGTQVTLEKFLNLSGLAPGQYTVRLKITDKSKNQVLTPSADFTVT